MAIDMKKAGVVIPREDGLLESTMYFDINGKPYTGRTMEEITLKWCADFEEANRNIGKTDVLGFIHVSTVWLGLNHEWGGGRPKIFETMIFVIGNGDYYCQRYSTKAEATYGHKWASKNAVKLVFLDSYNVRRLLKEVWSWTLESLGSYWTKSKMFLKSRKTRNTK